VGKDPTQSMQQKITHLLKKISLSHDVIKQLLHPHGLRMLRLQQLQTIYGKINTQHGFIYFSFFLLQVLLIH
jgi:hypothetical protein